MAAELQATATARGRQVDWQPFTQKTEAAEAARQQGDFLAAVRHCGSAISLVIAQLKSEGRAKAPSDSHVDLL